ncbi:LysM peptidoglycan-binding domain-containing protein [Acinetobacter baumannii]|uniref:LysM peptidoglycan-binding domain-containing protein n=2 Tax=Acinetobacter baumannii TaxID=470 RepID=A0A0J8TU74_ACIBA|nr:LysM peptidoglycan-binding domain-containing protein [Acinetobacter baumannii]EKU2424185.1 LysM peptidoglycan-binding domain-containing protein [Acinetobacter baumannii]EKV1717694.1 LysM peptidoglycan-binding domain-containing protein [Acinetobacter baumannii]EKX2701677.1 LysM peptidoglycan-binding domain-containing protein [Acinetobacter baumannii]EKX9478236.1 LysM peptidoglycan-binding domain-containing protein [Acinetobacter baumannii]EKY1319521.1 LysM peptidoglycan-binding domain-contai
MNKKSLVTIQILDLFGSPISKAQYEVKNQRTGQVIAAGTTNSSGCIVEISRDKGTALDVYIKSMFKGSMVKVQSFVMSKDRMVVKITSPKVLLNLKTLTNQGNNGQYKRKTHIVKKGDTLFEIAQKNHTTVRALERLNKIDDPNKISIGQVIKLPVHIPASGNHSHQDKSKHKHSAQPVNKPTASSTKTTPAPAAKRPANPTSQTKQENGLPEKVHQLYEDTKKALNEAASSASKILTVDDRSQDGGTPKANTTNICKTNPQCISSGKSELIREVNIRLAGFGGALPTDEFTELTATCIKQFQRDYMGVPDTGKICGSVLVALDQFYDEYPISSFMGKAACNCGKCSGFGNGKMGVQSGINTANEYPGIHRSLIWILKSLNFYLKNEFKDKKINVAYIESGYRCIENNKKHERTSVNHMGLALDIHFHKNGVRTRELSDMEFIRKNIMAKKMGASEQRIRDKIYLEPKVFRSGEAGATSWVHFDITMFLAKYFTNNMFKTKVSDLNGVKLVNLAASSRILSCGGIVALPKSQNNITDELVLSNEDIIDIMKVTETEVIKFKTEKYFLEQAAGVVDTIMNRTKSGVWGNSVRKVVNADRQFSKITGPKSLDPYGSVENMPMSHVSRKVRNFVNSYLLERANGKKSIIGENLNYANKYYSDEKNRKAWVDKFHNEAVKNGMILGTGKAIHAHGTVRELRDKMPKPFKIVLPKDFKGI